MCAVSTREYRELLPKMAETVGVSSSAISGKIVEASMEPLQQLQERRWENVGILVIYIDGQRFADSHIISAVGVDVGRPEAHHGHRAGCDRECNRRHASADSPGRPRAGDQSSVPVHHRWGQGTASRNRGGLWQRSASETLQQSHRRPTPALSRGVQRPLPGKSL